LEVGVPFLILTIVVPRETTAQTRRDQDENGAGKNRPQTFHGPKNNRLAAKGQRLGLAKTHGRFRQAFEMQNAECRMQNAECGGQDVELSLMDWRVLWLRK
jgi:hypothetical protein